MSRSQFASTTPYLLRSRQQSQPNLIRFAHNIPRPRHRSSVADTAAQSPSTLESEPPTPPSSRVAQQPHYELTFTCVPCGDRSRHKVSKQGYHHGSVLITCPGCRNRHVISDHLGIFGNRKLTVEDLMRERGQLVKRGALGEDGDVEFWEDGTITKREDGAQDVADVIPQSSSEQDDAPPGASFKSVGGPKSS